MIWISDGWVLQYLVYRDRVLRLCCWVLGDGLQDCAIWGNQSNWSRLYTSVHRWLSYTGFIIF